MMTDREVLELAAKAARYPLGVSGEGFFIAGAEPLKPWNPLEDNAAALALAARLRLGLIPIEGGGWDVVRYDSESCEEQTLFMTNTSGEKALRLGIVRAAAALA